MGISDSQYNNTLPLTAGQENLRTINRKGLGSVIADNLREKINSPIIFKPLSGDPAHGFEGTLLIDSLEDNAVEKQTEARQPGHEA